MSGDINAPEKGVMDAINDINSKMQKMLEGQEKMQQEVREGQERMDRNFNIFCNAIGRPSYYSSDRSFIIFFCCCFINFVEFRNILYVDVTADVHEQEKKLHVKIINFLNFLRQTYFRSNEAINIKSHKDVLKEFFDMDTSGGCKFYFVRESYVTLCELVGKNKLSIVTGSPGIGKSLFLIYWLRDILMNRNRNVCIYFFFFYMQLYLYFVF
jgi:hypothetical protein